MNEANDLSINSLLHRIGQRHIDGPDSAQALAELYDCFGSRTYALVVMILGERMAAQEVTQDVFLKIWHKPGAYHDEAGKFVSWLLTVARHVAFDYLRHEKRRCECVVSLDDEAFPELRDRVADEDQRWRDLASLMDELPAAQREPLILSYYRGMSQVDISVHLNVPLGTIKTRMKLGMDKLRTVWQHSGMRYAKAPATF